MCGIFGAVGNAVWRDQVRAEQAIESMRHRGPDGLGLWKSRGGASSPDQDLASVLGHARLSILDLTEAGRQPISTSDGRYTLVYNGEVYNFRELRRELEAKGETFTSTGDSEVVLKACARWGQEAPARFRGMFAFGLWDERDKSLLLARDRLGVKPLYVAAVPGGLAFASEVRALLVAGVIPRVLSMRGLQEFMRFGAAQEPFTLIEGVEAFPPGSVMVYDGRMNMTRRYWEMPSERSSGVSRDAAVARIGELLHESVRMHLTADVPFGIFLSGGADSSALAAIASRESSRPVHTFTVVFDETAFSEERWAAEFAKINGCVHHSVRVTGEQASAGLEEAFRAQDQPSGDGLNTWLVSRAARREGLAMALSGLGGDEVFAGYPNFRRFEALVRLSRVMAAIPATALSLMARQAATLKGAAGISKVLAVAQAGGRTYEVYGAVRRHFTERQIVCLTADGLTWPAAARTSIDRARADGHAVDFVNEFSRLELSNYLRNTLLRDTDYMSMANSVEVRVPFLDHGLLEYVLSLPGGMKLDGDGNKPLLFEAVPEMPRGIGLRRKMGFVLPLREWFAGPMRKPMERALLDSKVYSAGLLRRHAVEAAWSGFLDGRGWASASRIFALASLAAWVTEHDVEMPT